LVKKQKTKKMKNLLTLTTLLFMSLATFSQVDEEELIILKADRDWEKLIRTAEKYTQKDDTKNNPLPYYYMAYGLYKISFIGDRDEAYKNAYKDALSVVGKMMRKDDDGRIQKEYEEFFVELKLSLLEIIRNDFDAEEYRRSFGWVMKIYKFGRENIAGKFLEGAVRYRNNDKSTAKTKWKEGRELIAQVASANEFDAADREMIKYGLYHAAKCRKDARQQDEAKEIMNLGAQWFEDEKDWQRYYDEIVN
jgi:hypothetical protein